MRYFTLLLDLYFVPVSQWGATPLEDNLPTDTYHYQMTVCTGTKKTACTTSKISFILSGDDTDTGARRLYDGKRKVCFGGDLGGDYSEDFSGDLVG